MSYTSTIAYPDYNAVIPRIDVATGGSISWNDSSFDHRPRRISMSMFILRERDRLFTVGGFLKRIDHLIYHDVLVSGAAACRISPLGLRRYPLRCLHSVTTYVNDAYRSRTGAWNWIGNPLLYLPKPLRRAGPQCELLTQSFGVREYPYTDTRQVGRAADLCRHVLH